MKMHIWVLLSSFVSLTLATDATNQGNGSCCCKCNDKKQLNIIYILADDMGWNELGIHGNNQACTPNLDAMMSLCTPLRHFYTHPQCTPSRTALMTGYYAQTLGMQCSVISGAEPRCLPLDLKILPQYLKDLNYTNYHIGKWHLGSCKNACRPLQRGFHYSKGFFLGKTDPYGYDYREIDMNNPGKSFHGFNAYKGNYPCYNNTGKYITDVYTDEVVKIIKSKNCSSDPFFIYLAHWAIHAANDLWPLRAPLKDIERFSCLEDKGRVNLTAMTYALDRSIGRIFQALNDTGLLCNTIVIFTSDNGGTRSKLEYTNGTNCPLRGEKMTTWEGGLRVPGAVCIPCLNASLQGKPFNGYFHMVDWLKTLVCGAAKGNCSMFKNSSLDGKNLWRSLNTGCPSPRKEIVHLKDSSCFKISAITRGDWKLVCGGSFPAIPQNCMCGVCGRGPRQCRFCNESKVVNSPVARILSPRYNPDFSKCTVENLRKKYTINCKSPIVPNQNCPNCSCLFNIKWDPCENVNLALKYPQILAKLQAILAKKAEKPPLNRKADPRADPKYYDCTWTNWCDINNVTIN